MGVPFLSLIYAIRRLFSTIDRDRLMNEFRRAFTAVGIDILGEFSSTGIHLPEAEKHIIGTLVEVLRDICL